MRACIGSGVAGIMLFWRGRLVGEGLNPEKINIKAFLVSFWGIRNDIFKIPMNPLCQKIGRALKYDIFIYF